MKESEIIKEPTSAPNETPMTSSNNSQSDSSNACRETKASESQNGFFFLNQFYKNCQPLNAGLSIDLDGPLDKAALEASLNTLIERHEQLRSTFHSSATGVISRIHELGIQQLEEIDLSQFPESEKIQKLKLAEQEAICHPFDLAVLPLLRVSLVTLSPTEHTLIVVNHHITGDGTSLFNIYLNELSSLYTNFSESSDNLLPALEKSFDDFSRMQQEENSGETVERRFKFWKKQLDGAPPYIDIPSDNDRPPLPTGAGGRVEGPVWPNISKQVSSFAKSSGFNPVKIYLAAYFALLYRFTNQSDMVLGLPFANRLPEFSNVYGPMINTLPIRAHVDETTTFSELLLQVQQTAFLTILRGNLPFESLVANIANHKDLSRLPVQQIVFNYMTFSPKTMQLKGLNTNTRKLFPDSTIMDLVVDVEEQPGGLCVSINYNADVYDRDTIVRMIGTYELILNNALQAQDTLVQDISVLSQNDIDELTLKRNDTRRDYSNQTSIHESFEAQVDRTPDAIAVRCDGEALTYRELDKRANYLAGQLRAMGADRDRIIGICIPRQSEMIVGMLAILKSGSAYLPLDPKYPEERLAFMLEDSKTSIVITTSNLEGLITTEDQQTLVIDRIDFDQIDGPRLEPVNDLDDLAYIIYTSGSTGKPKGVMVEHRNVFNLFNATDEVLDHCPENAGTWVAVASISFDMSVLEIFWTLSRGFTVILQTDELSTSNSLASLILEHSATHLVCTPSQARALLSDKNSDLVLGKLNTLKMGGEALTLDIANKLQSKVTGNIVNGYGPTETTLYATSHLVLPEETKTIPIGRPIANTSVYVLDKNLNPVPQGVIGELFVGGAGVARGYLNRDELTEQRFLPDPFSNEVGRMYRTGDLVRYRKDGALEYIGREDHQVKLRGHRIELGEVESYLLKLEGVEEALPIVREDIPGDQKLVAYIVPNNSFDEQHARKDLASMIPSYMIPNLFFSIDKFPLTSNGKIDRASLPKPQNVLLAAQTADLLLPRNDTEIRLSVIWMELLGISRVDVRDDFFNLGGHSLLSLLLSEKIEAEFDTCFESVNVFMSPTIQEQAQKLLESTPESKSSVVTLQKNGDGPPIYCLCGIHLYQDLALLIGEEQPVHAMYIKEEINFLYDSVNHDQLEDLARAYYEVILKNHDGSPLRLLGFCFGGAIAYEVALLAEADGIEVDRLILLDSVIWCRLRRRSLLRVIRYAKKTIRKAPKVISTIFSVSPKQARPSPANAVGNKNDQMINALARHMTDYHPAKPINVNTVLVNSNDPNIFATWKVTSLLGWEEFLSGQTITINTFGKHAGIMRRPMIEQIAGQLQSLLATSKKTQNTQNQNRYLK